MKVKKQKTKTSGGFLFVFSMIILVLYCCYNIVDTQVQIAKKTAQLEEINAKISAANDKNAGLDELVNSDDNHEYVLKKAREELGYVFPGERVFVDISGS